MKEIIFNQAIDHLYRAPLDEGAWQSAFDTLARLLPCLGWQYFSLDASGDVIFSTYSPSLGTSDYQRLRGWLSDELVPALLCRRGTKTILQIDMPDPAGSQRATVCLTPGVGTSCSVLAWIPGQELSSAEDSPPAWLSRLLPHLEQAGRLHAETLRLQREVALRDGTLNRLGYPLLLIDESGGIRFFNNAADQWQAGNDAFCFRSGCLTGRSKENQVLLDQLLQSSLNLRRYSLRSVSCRDGRKPYQIIVIPLTDSSQTEPTNVNAMFLVAIGDLQSNGSLTIENIQALFGFTGAEARVTIGLAEGKTLEEIAQAGDVSINTVRSQLRQAMEKTGTCRQSELIRTITALPRLDLGIQAGLDEVPDRKK